MSYCCCYPVIYSALEDGDELGLDEAKSAASSGLRGALDADLHSIAIGTGIYLYIYIYSFIIDIIHPPSLPNVSTSRLMRAQTRRFPPTTLRRCGGIVKGAPHAWVACGPSAVRTLMGATCRAWTGTDSIR